MREKMFDIFNKNKIASLEVALETKSYTIEELRDEVLRLNSKLGDAIKIANGKRVVKCNATRCMDYDNGTCSLLMIDIKTDGKDAFCMDFDNGSVMEELKTELTGKTATAQYILSEK
jgi:hypothetical protein